MARKKAGGRLHVHKVLRFNDEGGEGEEEEGAQEGTPSNREQNLVIIDLNNPAIEVVGWIPPMGLLSPIKILADGNCLFASLYYVLLHSSDENVQHVLQSEDINSHFDLRLAMVAFIDIRKDSLMLHLDQAFIDDFNNCAHLSQAYVEGDLMCVAVASMFDIQVVIYESQEMKHWDKKGE